jgi:hypothetical protein
MNKGQDFGGSITSRFVTGGGLLSNRIPNPSSSIRAAL